VLDDTAKAADDAAEKAAETPLDTSKFPSYSFDWLDVPSSGADDIAKRAEDVLNDLERVHGPADGGALAGNAVGGKNASGFPAWADDAGSGGQRGKISEDHAKAAQEVLDQLDKYYGKA
jgi:hypothetical protein